MNQTIYQRAIYIDIDLVCVFLRGGWMEMGNGKWGYSIENDRREKQRLFKKEGFMG